MFKAFFWIMALIIGYHLLTKKYINPYTLTMVFGKKGSGKSTLMVRLAYKYLERGWTVFCTEPLDGCYLLDYADVGRKHLPPKSVILVDEVGMIWDNRNYKNFPPEVRDWFKLQRHYKCKVFLFSQTFDVDKKLRDLTDDMYLCTNVLRVFSWAKRITRRTILTKPMGDAPARIDEELAFDWFIFWPFGARIMTFIPKYAKYFDSHGARLLPHKDYDYNPPLNVPHNLRKRLKRARKSAKSKKVHKSLILLRSGFSAILRLFSKLLGRKNSR